MRYLKNLTSFIKSQFNRSNWQSSLAIKRKKTALYTLDMLLEVSWTRLSVVQNGSHHLPTPEPSVLTSEVDSTIGVGVSTSSDSPLTSGWEVGVFVGVGILVGILVGSGVGVEVGWGRGVAVGMGTVVGAIYVLAGGKYPLWQCLAFQTSPQSSKLIQQ